jgi:hypothetical protein
MKARVKKRITNRKKQFASSKKTTRSVKAKKSCGDSKKADKQPIKSHTSKGTKGDNLPFKKNNKHGFQKGKSGNPKGRPKLGHTRADHLLRGLRDAESEAGKNLLKHFFKEAFTDNHLLAAAMKKLYPDLKSIEQITVASDSMTEKEATDIRKEIAKRFETK